MADEGFQDLVVLERDVAEPIDDGYRFDVRLQGEDETVFFAV